MMGFILSAGNHDEDIETYSASDATCVSISPLFSASLPSSSKSTLQIDTSTMTEFPRFETLRIASLPRPILKRFSISEQGDVRQKALLELHSNTIPIQFYRFGWHITVLSNPAVVWGKATFYSLQITRVAVGQPLLPKTVLKRYKELLAFHQSLLLLYPKEMSDAPPFPPKNFLGRWNPQIVAQRIQELKPYLMFCVLHPVLVASPEV
ncbi:hypothetical protein HDU91_001971, partial [Kappamyces sp. JEL0680]